MFKFLNRHHQGIVVGGGAFATLYAGSVILNSYLTGVNKFETLDEEDSEEIDRQKVYLVTGANSGIGKTLAADLAKRKQNNKVYMLCRNMDSCEEVRSEIVKKSGNKYVYCRPCDLASFNSIRECAKMIQSKEDRIDGLVNNAGIMYAPRGFTVDGIETHWSVNHLGHYLLTRLLSDQLENGGRVIYMVNLDYRKARDGIKFEDINMQKDYDKSYAFYQSQLANVLIMRKLAKELESRLIAVNAVYPGIVRGTQIKRHMGLDKSKVSKHISNTFLGIVEQNVSDAVQTPLFLLLDRSMTGMTGKMFTNMNEMAILDAGLDEDSGKKLTMINDYWTGLKSKEDIAAEKSSEKIVQTSAQ